MAKKTAKPVSDAAVTEAEAVITEEAEPASGGEKRMYEVMLVLKPDLIESNLQKKLRDFKKYLEDHECKVTEEDIWEKRRLSYKIRQYGEGIYAVYDFESLPSFIHELENYLRIDNDVIRHLVITLPADYKYIKFREEPEEERPAKKERYAPPASRGTVGREIAGSKPEEHAYKKPKEEIKEVKKEEETKLVSTEPPEAVSGEKEPKKEKKESLLSKLLKKKPKEEKEETEAEKPEKKKEEKIEEKPEKEEKKKEEKISRIELDEKLDKLLGGDDLNI
jgi:small subunit ribosomal protein S6